ncbi:hypothetical protein OYC64_008745 [Pagothenia borchgrevinki]|uniref:Uncharacterized protein n=1 Tax=Pagothenia borchgrevinki TaxID=8213 RepID=A0ABD2G671_PAGBO
MTEFDAWKLQFGRSYNSPVEEAQRRENLAQQPQTGAEAQHHG